MDDDDDRALSAYHHKEMKQKKVQKEIDEFFERKQRKTGNIPGFTPAESTLVQSTLPEHEHVGWKSLVLVW